MNATRMLLSISVLLAACAHGQSAPSPSEPSAATQPSAPSGPPETVAVRVLVVGFRGAAHGAGPDRTAAEALERARTLSQLAREGERLRDLIVDYSERPGAREDSGHFKLRTADPAPFDAAVLRAALALPIGGISEPVETAQGYVVIERLPDPPPGPDRIAARHILITYAGSPQSVPGATRSEAEARAIAAKVAAEAAEPGAKWEALAGQYTEEPGGKERAGDLGTFARGQMVPAFEAAAFALEVGQVSGVVRSPFGFHVIQRYQ